MEVFEIYAVALGSLFTLIIGWHLAAIAFWLRKRCTIFVRKNFSQALVLSRFSGSTDFTVGSLCLICLLLIGNLVASSLFITSREQLRMRLQSLFLINLVPMWLKGRTSLIAERVLGLSYIQYSLLHRYLGWICIMQGLGYGILSLASKEWSADVAYLTITISTALAGAGSVLSVRRSFFELFLKLHLIFALGISIGLWISIDVSLQLTTICLVASMLCWGIDNLLWIARLIFFNWGGKSKNEGTLTHYDEGSLKVDAMLLKIEVRRPWHVLPGQYVYISIPNVPHSVIGRLQSHPYLIAWSDGDTTKRSNSISLLIECRNGFSNALRLCRSPMQVSLDGPYGQTRCMDEYDKVFFVASGAGVAAHLLAIRQLLRAHDERTARVRRISLTWFLQSQTQEAWARAFLDTLLDLDTRRIFTVLIYGPFEGRNRSANSLESAEQRPRLYRVSGALDIEWLLAREWDAEAGNMVLSLCGPPLFERRVRSALRKSPHDIHLITSPFKMDETEDSYTASFRFRNVPRS